MSIAKSAQNLIEIRKNKILSDIYDVEITDTSKIKDYDNFECHLVIYPYSRKISADNLKFSPYEEYVEDILKDHRSAYSRIIQQFNEFFGLILGGLITLLFAVFKPDELFSVESVVSVFAAYAIGKEIWDDIESSLIRGTKNWKLRYQEIGYLYQLEKHTTLTHYSSLAKKRRLGKEFLSADRMDFIPQSNSKTVRLWFNGEDLNSLRQTKDMHILAIHIDEEKISNFEKEGFLLGVKLSLNKKSFGIRRCLEFFQSIDGSEYGCLDESGVWHKEAVFSRKTMILGRWKYFLSREVLADQRIILMPEKIN